MTGTLQIIAAEWARQINEAWQSSLGGILEAGRLLIEAKAELAHGDWEKMVERELLFGPRAAQMVMCIARDTRLTNAKHRFAFPPHWGTLYEITKLSDEQFEEKLADGTIRPDVERSEIKALVKAAKLAPILKEQSERVEAGCTIDDLHQEAATGAQYGTILADPPWKFLTRSEKGKDRSPKYRTDPLADIKALPVPALAAKDSVCLIWCVDWFIPAALEVMKAWGFEFKTVGFTWAKQNASGKDWFMGQGYWTRANPEMCLLGTKGNPIRLHADVRQLLVAPIEEHSRKPDEIHKRIERLVPGPYLELYGRRLRDNWKVWGDEIARSAFEADLPPHDPITGEIHEDGEAHVDIPLPQITTPKLDPGTGEGALSSDPVPGFHSPEDDIDLPNFRRVGHEENAWANR